MILPRQRRGKLAHSEFYFLHSTSTNAECVSSRLRVTAGAVLATPRQVPAFGATNTQLRQRRREFGTFYIKNSKFYIFASRVCADSLMMPKRLAIKKPGQTGRVDWEISRISQREAYMPSGSKRLLLVPW